VIKVATEGRGMHWEHQRRSWERVDAELARGHAEAAMSCAEPEEG